MPKDIVERLSGHERFFREQHRHVLARDMMDAMNEIVRLRDSAGDQRTGDEIEEQVLAFLSKRALFIWEPRT